MQGTPPPAFPSPPPCVVEEATRCCFFSRRPRLSTLDKTLHPIVPATPPSHRPIVSPSPSSDGDCKIDVICESARNLDSGSTLAWKYDTSIPAAYPEYKTKPEGSSINFQFGQHVTVPQFLKTVGGALRAKGLLPPESSSGVQLTVHKRFYEDSIASKGENAPDAKVVQYEVTNPDEKVFWHVYEKKPNGETRAPAFSGAGIYGEELIQNASDVTIVFQVGDSEQPGRRVIRTLTSEGILQEPDDHDDLYKGQPHRFTALDTSMLAVWVNVYDLTSGSSRFVGKLMEKEPFHSGIEFGGSEFQYSGGVAVERVRAQAACGGKWVYRHSILVGFVDDYETAAELFDAAQRDFAGDGELYRHLYNNCNTFTLAMCDLLLPHCKTDALAKHIQGIPLKLRETVGERMSNALESSLVFMQSVSSSSLSRN
ncbi:unnamed protein product [Amoebophrya sp. A120]|nr:unnamed protein product [Amoebophrya sp. A120]|eukprot:GSA120T00025296001.1